MAIKFGRPLESRVRFAPDETEAPAQAGEQLDLRTRPRRNRRTAWARRLVRESILTTDDLIWPIFIVDGKGTRVPVASMPGVERLSVDQAVREAERAAKLDIPCLALFPYTDPTLRDDNGSEALNPDNLVCRAIRAIKKEVPDIGILCDVALDPYTSHGHDGLLRGGEIINDETLELIARTAVSHVEAGADAVCPSDMMDGRVGAIREELPETPILAYSAKYASAFYGPFREAAESAPAFGDRRGYQMDPANVREALRECEQDVAEGADVLMVKPALPYLDVIRAVRERFDHPLAAYNVSGEYAMVKAAAAAGYVDERAAALESLVAIKRAGADLIFTYWAKDVAEWL